MTRTTHTHPPTVGASDPARQVRLLGQDGMPCPTERTLFGFALGITSHRANTPHPAFTGLDPAQRGWRQVRPYGWLGFLRAFRIGLRSGSRIGNELSLAGKGEARLAPTVKPIVSRRGWACLTPPFKQCFGLFLNMFSQRANIGVRPYGWLGFLRALTFWGIFGTILLSPVTAQDKSITVFAASSLTEAFTEISQTYIKSSGVAVRFQFAGSQILRTQLENGARADIFASASLDTYQPLVDKNLLEKAQIFARNRLVVITSKRGAARVKTLADLALPQVRLVVAQNTVPVGAYTQTMLRNLEKTGRYGLDFVARVQKNVVSEEVNVRQVVLKVRLGEADAGVVYATDVTPEVRSSLIQIGIPERQNVIAQYPIGVLRDSNPTARDFVAYVLSPAGQGILQRWGFLKKPN